MKSLIDFISEKLVVNKNYISNENDKEYVVSFLKEKFEQVFSKFEFDEYDPNSIHIQLGRIKKNAIIDKNKCKDWKYGSMITWCHSLTLYPKDDNKKEISKIEFNCHLQGHQYDYNHYVFSDVDGIGDKFITSMNIWLEDHGIKEID